MGAGGTWNLGNQSRKGGEVCEELRMRLIDVSCLQEVRWRGQGDRILGMKGRRYMLWKSGKGDGVGGVANEELCEKVLRVRSVSDSDHCCCFSRKCAEVDMLECSAMWKKCKTKSLYMTS